MANYSFIINVGNAIDKSHFRMYFHESISTKRLSFYDIEDFSELKDKVTVIGKHIDRNVFEADSNYLYICTSRKWADQTDLLWWTLFQKSYVYSSIPEEIQKKIKKVYLIIVDYDENIIMQIDGRRDTVDTKLLETGYLEDGVVSKSWDAIAHPVVTEEQLRGIGNLYDGSGFDEELEDVFDENVCGSAYCQFIMNSLDHFKELSDKKEADGTAVYSFTKIVKTDFKEKFVKKINRIDTLIIKVDPADQAAKRLSQMKLVTFLVNSVDKSDISEIDRDFRRYEQEFDPVAEALKLKRFDERIDNQIKKLEKKTDEPLVEFTYREIRPISELTSEKLIGNDEAINNTLSKVMGFRNKENWDKDFEELLNDISSYEEKLKDYGKEVNKEFHKNKNEAISERTVSYENDNVALAEIEKEIEAANDHAYRERDKGDNTFATIVDITNQFNKVGRCLKKLNTAKTSGSKVSFAGILLFIFIMIIVPYSISQTYIYAGLLEGNFMPLICIGVLLLAVLLAKPVASIALDTSFRREARKLQDQVRRYFDGIQDRQRLFHDGVNSMIAIWNAQQKYDACQEAIAVKLEDHQRLDYHKNALNNFDRVMKYFDSFIANYYDEECGYILQTDRTELKKDKDVTDNRIYWIDKVVDAA
ncbi:MAG: hypothetical protein IJH43_02550 [Mogibacterium sp.]|nr:hypothetical protein [Mogibacterium sp.]